MGLRRMTSPPTPITRHEASAFQLRPSPEDENEIDGAADMASLIATATSTKAPEVERLRSARKITNIA